MPSVDVISPITSQQEQSRDAGLGAASVCDHVEVLTVVVLGIISDQYSFAPRFLDVSGLLHEGATSVGQTETVEQAEEKNKQPYIYKALILD